MSERANQPNPSSDWLEHMLADDARTHRTDYLDDGGFTARVMASLPAAPMLPAWRKPIIFLLWAVAAAVLALTLPEIGTGIVRDVLRFVATYPVTLSGIATGVIALLVASWAAAAMALRNDV